MNFADSIRQLLRESPEGMTPQQVRDAIKQRFPQFYDTDSHRTNVEKGHYKDIEHALLAQIYVAQRSASDIYADRKVRPMRLTLIEGEADAQAGEEDALGSEDFACLEAGIGTVYVLGTNTFTKNGEEIVKIGVTTGPIEQRISQLYNTSAPYKFRVIETYQTKNYAELEQALHRLLDTFRISKSREYFTDRCIPYIRRVVDIHSEVLERVATSE